MLKDILIPVVKKEAKSSRYATTEYNRSMRVESKLREVYDSVRQFCLPFSELQKRLIAVYASSDYKKLTPYYSGRASMLRDCYSAEWYRYALEWRVRYNGALVLSKDVPEGEWSKVQYVWRADPSKIYSDFPHADKNQTDCKYLFDFDGSCSECGKEHNRETRNGRTG